MSIMFECDRCHTHVRPENGYEVDYEAPGERCITSIHLCKRCSRDFEAFIDDMDVLNRLKVYKAYQTLTAVFFNDEATIEDCSAAIEEAIGYLGEVLD